MDRAAEAVSPDDAWPALGARVYDTATEIDGVLVALTQWYDRSDEAAILRPGVNAEGIPWPIHWIPVSRLSRRGASS